MVKLKSFSAVLMSVLALNSILSVTPISAAEMQVSQPEISEVQSEQDDTAVESLNNVSKVGDAESATGVDVSDVGDGSVLADYDTTTGVLRIYPGSNGTRVLKNDWRNGAEDYYVEMGLRDKFKKLTIEPGVKAPEDSTKLFASFSNVEEMDLSGLDTSEVVNTQLMFYGCKNLESLDVSNFDTSNVTFMEQMFSSCSNLKSLDLSSFNTENVTEMSMMFDSCFSLETINLSSFNTSNVGGFGMMFYDCNSLKSLDISHFDTSKAIWMNRMFVNCKSLESIDVSNFDTSGEESFFQMFAGCSNLKTLDISNFDTSKVKSFREMFDGCTSLETLTLGQMDTKAAFQFTNMFKDCRNLKNLDISSFDLSNTSNDTYSYDPDEGEVRPDNIQYYVEGMLQSLDSLEEIKTPKTIPVSFNEIPVTDSNGNSRTMRDSDGNTYKYLPLESKTLYLSKEDEKQDDSKKDITDPYSEAHKTDASDVETVSSGNAKFVFDAEKSDTVVVAKKYDISKKLKNLEKDSAYVSSAKHRYTVDNKNVATINKKGQLKPKKSGEVNISLEQKEKGGSWKKIGAPVHMYIQMPKMKKDETAKKGTTLDAYKFLSHTTYAPTKWMSTNRSVATVDEKGVITVLKKGKAKIVAVYGDGKNSSKKKYATKIKVTE